MHIIYDENGNINHSHHSHSHTHTYEHTHEHVHQDGADENHEHSHDSGHTHECEGTCAGTDCSGCSAQSEETTALLAYMLSHNEHHAAELDQMAANLRQLGMEEAASHIEKAVTDFQTGNMRLSVALSIVKEKQA